MTTIHVHDTGLFDKVKVLEIDTNKDATAIEGLINQAISDLGGLKVLSVSSSVRINGKLIVIIHHLSKN